MKRAALAPLLLIMLVGVAQAADFAEMVRDLNVMQNRMVTGDMKAREQAARQFDLIEKSITSLEPDAWADERNQRAAIVYLLAGGAPVGLRAIHDAEFDAGKLGPLIGASVEYAEERGVAFRRRSWNSMRVACLRSREVISLCSRAARS